jgi:CelD/BcsL family acetyltransferase involved in cellulose biosynthesis
MRIALDVINPGEYPLWDALLLASGRYSFFHTSSWARVLIDTYHFLPRYFFVEKDGKLLVSVPTMEISNVIVRKKGVSLPFSDYCDPVIGEGLSVNMIVEQVISYAVKAGWQSVEIRGCSHFPEEIRPASYSYRHTLELLGDEEKIFASFRKDTKARIKQATREGVETKIYSSYEAVEEFYRLHSITRKRHGLPPQPFLFFKNIFEHIIAHDQGFVVLARYRQRTIAGAVFFHFGDTSLYKYAASDHAYQRLGAGHLVLWEAIQWFIKQGYRTLCFGKTAPENQGLRHFKRGWNAQEDIINDYVYNVRKKAFTQHRQKVFGFHNHIFKRMPVWMLKLIGSAVYRYMA